jgi:hypothetical protein
MRAGCPLITELSTAAAVAAREGERECTQTQLSQADAASPLRCPLHFAAVAGQWKATRRKCTGSENSASASMTACAVRRPHEFLPPTSFLSSNRSTALRPFAYSRSHTRLLFTCNPRCPSHFTSRQHSLRLDTSIHRYRASKLTQFNLAAGPSTVYCTLIQIHPRPRVRGHILVISFVMV